MRLSDNIIEAYGETVTSGGSLFKGFFSPIEPKNAENKHIPLAAGVANEARYLLITNVETEERSVVSVHGESYEVLRAEPIYFAGTISHYECILRPKGSAANV